MFDKMKARRSRKSEEIAYTARGDFSVYPDAVRKGTQFEPITPTTVATVDYTGSGAGQTAASFMFLVIQDQGWLMREKFMSVDEKRAHKIADAVNQMAEQARLRAAGS
jgi:hypothetical protein